MLFNSYVFILGFLPLTLCLYYLTAKHSLRLPLAVLVAASLFFYGWWNPTYLLLIAGSMGFNFAVGRRLILGPSKSPALLAFGITTNLLLLGYFKYADFFVANLAALVGADWHLGEILLPLAISFFTFQQIAFLVDAHRGHLTDVDPLHYALFVTFFPQLIAGPIVHHSEVLPQFASLKLFRPTAERFAVGGTIFMIGLCKKVLLADGAAPYVDRAFRGVAAGGDVTFLEAWSAALFYAMQLYFDFSGYADMAIGGARLFGIRLPLNFHSPYRAVNIIDFWKRWHMTLSRFLRDYLYIPLGGNRRGSTRRYVNLMATMLIGGLWHGAGWSFVIWGGLHGCYLVCNHAWRALRETLGWSAGAGSVGGRLLSRTLTFLAVCFAWVFFRAPDLGSALSMAKAMLGGADVVLPASYGRVLGLVLPTAAVEHVDALLRLLLSPIGVVFEGALSLRDASTVMHLAFLLAIAFCLPNTQQIMEAWRPALTRHGRDDSPDSRVRLRWSPNTRWAVVMSVMAVAAVLSLNEVSEFLYFQF